LAGLDFAVAFEVNRLRTRDNSPEMAITRQANIAVMDSDVVGNSN
jgi:hypothetical protein